MKERLKDLRKALVLTQQAFADKIGMKQNTIAQYEMGRTVPSDAIIFSICREFNVNEEWLRTGEGEMFKTLTRAEEIAKLTVEIFKNPSSFRTKLIEELCKLSYEDMKRIEGFVRNLSKELPPEE